MEYRKTQLDEFLYLIKKGFNYSELLTMPIYLRRYYVNYIIEIENKQ